MICIGIDGADSDTVFKPAAKGQLPNICRVMDTGAYGPLYSITTSSAGAWTSHLTGVNPERSGVTSFVVDEENRFSKTSDIRVETYPEYLAKEGITVGTLNLPLTYPPFELHDGFSVSGQLTPTDTEYYTNPEELTQWLDEHGYQIDFRFKNRRYGFVDDDIVAEVSRETVREHALDILKRRADVASELLTTHKPDLFLVMFKNTDSLQHYFWDCVTDEGLEGPLLDSYDIIDNFVGHVCERYPDERILIFSDHGFRTSTRGEGRIAEFYQDTFIPTASEYIPYNIKSNKGFNHLQYAVERLFTMFADSSKVLHNGVHRPTGIWITNGEDIANVEKEGLGFLDLPPYIVHSMDIPIPTEYEGHLPDKIYTSSPSPEYIDKEISMDRDSVTVDDLAIQNLEALGYVETFEGDESRTEE